jgi:hypothetical protein
VRPVGIHCLDAQGRNWRRTSSVGPPHGWDARETEQVRTLDGIGLNSWWCKSNINHDVLEDASGQVRTREVAEGGASGDFVVAGKFNAADVEFKEIVRLRSAARRLAPSASPAAARLARSMSFVGRGRAPSRSDSRKSRARPSFRI